MTIGADGSLGTGLLEEKGVHLEGNSGPPQDTGAPKGTSGGDKPGVGQKIKDALHVGKHE